MKPFSWVTGIAARAASCEAIEPRFVALEYSGHPDDLTTFAADLREQFPFLRGCDEENSDDDRNQFDGLFAWLADQLRYQPQGVPFSQRRVVDVLVLAMELGDSEGLWGELAKSVERPSPSFIDGLAEAFASERADGRRFLKQARLPEEKISVVRDFMTRRDWKSLEGLMDRASGFLWLPMKCHAGAALFHYDRPRLQSMLDATADLLDIAAYVLHAPMNHALDIALSSSNWTLKFWALHRSVKEAERGGVTYAAAWQALLTEAARLPVEWARWMAILNEYPSRYRTMQASLGSALIKSSEEARAAYIESISDVADYARLQVAEALSVFQAGVSLEERKQLWSAAYLRWEKWDFGCKGQSRCLFNVARSTFDFPVMGYMIECQSLAEREATLKKLETRAASIERSWHSGVTEVLTERYRLISAYQLVAHAEAVLAGKSQWLHDGPFYRPPWEDGTAFRSLKYDSGMGQVPF